MKKQTILLVILLVTFHGIRASELFDKIQKLPNVTSIEELDVISFFSEKYLVQVKQPVDHSDTTKGFFNQRVILCHKGYSNPMVMITEGYNANYALRKSYKNELCDILDANQLCIEHRYFESSTPDPLNWKYLTTKNAAADQHVINQMFKTIYTGKWIATGISKGGQTAILYKAYYPDDVDVTVPYVAPVNFGVEDGRHEPFIANAIGTAKDRKKILDFQLEVLKRRDRLMSSFKAFIDRNHYTFKANLDTVYDLCVLEYSFAFWQWGKSVKDIPVTNAPDSVIFKNFMDVSSPDYFSIEGSKKYLSFFVQAAHELGYYGYDTKPFKQYLVMKDAGNYLLNYFLKGVCKPKWLETMKWASEEVQKNGNNMLFIYGEWDPWSAPAYVKGDRKDQLVIYKPHGSHRARINNLPYFKKKKAVRTLKKWLEK
ncbi:S28 family serine protease [Saccharicrinis sp. FJH62]|uniref:S28 family serine protease n=1 Tax=Saccharicrinis sp. FJH62 TaxID=3344657 RepID=UPI0035D46E90